MVFKMMTVVPCASSCLITCPITRQVLWEILGSIGLPDRFNIQHQDILTTWEINRQQLGKEWKKGVDPIFHADYMAPMESEK